MMMKYLENGIIARWEFSPFGQRNEESRFAVGVSVTKIQINPQRDSEWSRRALVRRRSI